MAASLQSEVPMVGSVAKMVNRLSKVDDPILKMNETKKQLHIVVYEYKAQQADELDMEVNDIIEIMKSVEDGWNRGKNERTGKTGMYPTNYCEVYRSKVGATPSGINKQYLSLKKTDGNTPFTGEVPAAIKRISGMEVLSKGKEENIGMSSTISPSISSSPPTLSKEESEKEFARVTFDYESQHEDELSLKVGQIVWVTNKRTTDSGWYEGEVDGRRGLFPDNFVALIKRENGLGSSWSNNEQSSQQPPILPPPSISSSLSNTPSGRVGDKPPASLPGAVSVMPLPPQVPAKPPKSMGGVGNGINSTPSIVNGVGWKISTSGGTAVTPSTPSTTTAISTTNTCTTASSVKDEEKEKDVIKPPISSFKDKQANLLASLNISSLNPSIPRPAASLSKSTTRIDQEGVSNENGDLLSKETPLLSHPTKNRPKVPSGVRRPVSMFPPPSSDFTSSTSKDGMSRSEVVLNDQPAPIGSSTSLSPSALSITPPLPSKSKEIQPTIVSSSRSSTSTPTPSTPTPIPVLPINHNPQPDIHQELNKSQWVSRSEYDKLLSKVNQLEERLAAIERL